MEVSINSSDNIQRHAKRRKRKMNVQNILELLLRCPRPIYPSGSSVCTVYIVTISPRIKYVYGPNHGGKVHPPGTYI